MSKMTLGGAGRIGSGSKINVDLNDYGRSTHNLSKTTMTSMAVGTLVPTYCQIGQLGDTFEIDLNMDVRTLPTVGPLFGKFKVSNDVYVYDMRLLNKLLYNDRLDVGRNMDKVLFPKITIKGAHIEDNGQDPNQQQIDQSSLISYLGIRGLGVQESGVHTVPMTREFFGGFVEMYYDIYKNYYANKQEGVGYVINGTYKNNNVEGVAELFDPYGANGIYQLESEREQTISIENSGAYVILKIKYVNGMTLDNTKVFYSEDDVDYEEKTINDLFNTGYVKLGFINNVGDSWNIQLICVSRFYLKSYDTVSNGKWVLVKSDVTKYYSKEIDISEFDLKNIDETRDAILSQSDATALDLADREVLPYTAVTSYSTNGSNFASASSAPMAGLCLKTYQSDKFNNWLDSEWINGDNGVNELSKIDVSDGELFMDTLNLQKKIYYLMNRIAMSGGSYSDWQVAKYGQQGEFKPNSAVYCGGSSQTIGFEEVVSTTPTEDKALGTLAGRGINYDKQNGKVRIKCSEDCLIMVITSITPYVTYSQGNKWFNDLRNMQDLHSPQLDQIGFQPLLTDEFAAFNTTVDSDGNVQKNAIGYQPAWIEYMTDTDEAYGDFATSENMWMTLNRQYGYSYEYDRTTQRKVIGVNITDATTYIDPIKYNYAFAETGLTAQNFWVMVQHKVEARRIISAKVMPTF